MHTHLRKWGNSLGVRIPKEIAKQLQLHFGSPVTIELKNERIIIQVPKYHLNTMLNEITSKNQHAILDDAQQGIEW
jgi:antitoxin MazE